MSQLTERRNTISNTWHIRVVLESCGQETDEFIYFSSSETTCGGFTHPLSRKERDERGTSIASSLLFELGSSAGGTGVAPHGVMDLSVKGLDLAISSSADTIPADVPSSSSLCCIVGFARPVPVDAFFLSSHNAVDVSPKCSASYLIGSQLTVLPAGRGDAEAEEGGLPADDRFGGTEAVR